jgi:hypothetical protein
MSAVYIYGCPLYTYASYAFSLGNSLHDCIDGFVDMHNDALAHPLVGADTMPNDRYSCWVVDITGTDNTTYLRRTDIETNIVWSC